MVVLLIGCEAMQLAKILVCHEHTVFKDHTNDSTNRLLQDLGAACNSKRPTCAMMIKSHENYKEAYGELWKDVKALPLPI